MTTPNGSPELAVSQASKEATVNEQVRRTERGASFYPVVDKDQNSPPGSCADGAVYIIGSSPSGLWAGRPGDIAVAVGTNASNGWYIRDAEEGIFAWVQDENVLYRCDGGTSPITWSTYNAGSAVNLGDLADVDVASPNDGEVLTYDTDSPTGWKALKIPFELEVAGSDETTALTTGTAKITFRMPCAVVLDEVRASLSTAQTSGGPVTVDINEGGVSILSTKLTIDNGAKTSVGSSPAAVISDSALADNAEITVDIDNIGDGTAKGLKVLLKGRRA